MKREQLRRVLASDLLKLELGNQLPTIRDLATTYHSSVGTVQTIITEFEQANAVEIERRGWMGTYLRGRSLAQLWSAAQGSDPMVIALPLPSTRTCEGLATAIKTLLLENGIEVYLVFLRGSRRRLETLRRQRCHGAVISVFAARDMCSPAEICVLELPAQTYIKEHRVFYLDQARQTQSGALRVATDCDSADLQRLTELEYQSADVEFVPVTFMQYAELLARGEVDAIVWDVDEAQGKLPPFVYSRTLSDHVLQSIGDSNTRASIVGRSSDDVFNVVIRQCLDPERLLDIQQEVVTGKRVPSY